jgi:hypothetical protein
MASSKTTPNSTAGHSIPFPWKGGMFGKGSIVGPDKYPDYLGKPVKGERIGKGGGGNPKSPPK